MSDPIAAATERAGHVENITVTCALCNCTWWLDRPPSPRFLCPCGTEHEFPTGRRRSCER